MDIIRYPQPIDFSSFTKNACSAQPLYGLPEEVKFCKSCVISNQRPNSAVEYKHTKESKKKTINFDDKGVCDACNFAERKKRSLIGSHEKSNCESFAINIARMMEAMTASSRARVVKTASMLRMF